MSKTDPPAFATWMLQRFPPGKRNEALAGDLLEEFQSGRSAGWYWRQVLGALVIGCSEAIRNHRTATLFAVLWSMLTPAWLLVVASLEWDFHLPERVWRMTWPWSTVCNLGLMLGTNLLFIWIGIALYLMSHLWSKRNQSARPLRRGIWASVPAVVTLWAALIVLPQYFLESRSADLHAALALNAQPVEHRTPDEAARMRRQEESTQFGVRTIDRDPNLRAAVVDTRTAAIIVRLPFFLCVFCALWGAEHPWENSRKGVPT